MRKPPLSILSQNPFSLEAAGCKHRPTVSQGHTEDLELQQTEGILHIQVKGEGKSSGLEEATKSRGVSCSFPYPTQLLAGDRDTCQELSHPGQGVQGAMGRHRGQVRRSQGWSLGRLCSHPPGEVLGYVC